MLRSPGSLLLADELVARTVQDKRPGKSAISRAVGELERLFHVTLVRSSREGLGKDELTLAGEQLAKLIEDFLCRLYRM